MTRLAARRQKSPTINKLRKTLKFLAETPPQNSYREAKEFVCTVCNLPVKPCEADARATCFHMMREGTEIQSLHSSEKDGRRLCISCGRSIPRKSLEKNPTAELCPTCTKKSMKMRTRSLSKGISP